MNRKIRIRKVSSWSIGITIALGLLFAFICVMGEKEFHILRDTTNQYIHCENATKQLQDGSDYLTEQVRLYAMTGDVSYMKKYFDEVNITKRREVALEELKQYFDGTETFNALKSALEYSDKLTKTECYSMRLVSESIGINENKWPEEIVNIKISEDDEKLSDEGKLKKAQNMLCDANYVKAKTEITDKVTECSNDLITQTKNSQGRASTIFSDMYLKLELGILIQIILTLTICMLVRKLIVKPLISYNQSIQVGEIFPVIGAEELQNLAVTYNKVYAEKQETEMLIRHQAEHDALTDLLNRGSFEKILKIYETGEKNDFAMILIDVDVFKSVNDTYGHAVGDIILKKVATLLKGAFRTIDYVCRIGGDEFAIIMVEMTSDLKYTIEDKIASVNKRLGEPEEGVPAVSLSVGVAFSDRENPGESIFKDADKALYYVKEHGRKGCGFY